MIGSHRRTLKVLLAIARGLWVVSCDWVLCSIERGSWLAEHKYEAVDWFPGCRASRESKERGEGPLLGGLRVFVNGHNVLPPREDLVELLVSGGAQVVGEFRACTLCISSSAAIRPKRNPNATPIVRSEWLVDSLQDYVLKEYAPYSF